MPARHARRSVPHWVKTQIQSYSAHEDDPAYDSDTSSTISATSTTTHLSDSAASISSTLTTLSSLPDDPSSEPSLPINRRFRPELIYPSTHFTPRDIEVPRGRWVYLACPHSRVKCSHCGVHVAHTDAIVIAMDGAYRSNPTNTTGDESGVSSLAVFAGFGNPYNRAQRIPNLPRNHHNSQTAQLKACIRALCQAGLIGEDRALPSARGGSGRDVRLVVVKCDSEFVVRGVTELMAQWKMNGWRNSRGVEVANAEDWRVIDRLVHSLRVDGIEVRFWLVERRMNGQARGMARNLVREGVVEC
ncbi:hypothetical protein BJX64DRAFT_288506 [Aspergillus heterothallicus]